MPFPRPRLVATDLDGTLLRADGSVSERTRRALLAAEEAGIHVVFVTARPPRWLGHLAGVVGGHGQVVCLGGAAVWDLATGTALEAEGFTSEEACALAADLRAAVPGVHLAVERLDGPVLDAGFRTSEPVHPDWVAQPETGGLEGALEGTEALVGKILAVTGEREVPPDVGTAASGPATRPAVASGADEEFFARVRDVVGDRAQLAYSGAGGLAELVAPHVSKKTALARWCAREGIDAADVWAFGDMPNDLPMLRWAGRGIAVVSAHPEVLAAADAVVGSNDDDGVAVALEEVLAPR